jgi:hypothetical protein
MVRLLWLLPFLAGPVFGQLLPEGQDQRDLPFVIVDGKPLLPVSVDGQAGSMMLDNGTPETVMFNRDAAMLEPGQEVARGNAASGQPVIVMLHPAPRLEVAGHPLPLGERVVSGDLGFAEAGFGPGFMGFIGSPAVEAHPFLLDFDRQVLRVWRAVEVPEPEAFGRIVFSYWPGEQPTTAGLIGGFALLVDVDTGDQGTLYLRDKTQVALEAAGLLSGGPDVWTLSGLQLGEVGFAPTEVRVVRAGGPGDFRRSGPADFLRLGAGFLAENPTLWDFPQNTLVFLRPEAAVLSASGPAD